MSIKTCERWTVASPGASERGGESILRGGKYFHPRPQTVKKNKIAYVLYSMCLDNDPQIALIVTKVYVDIKSQPEETASMYASSSAHADVANDEVPI